MIGHWDAALEIVCDRHPGREVLLARWECTAEDPGRDHWVHPDSAGWSEDYILHPAGNHLRQVLTCPECRGPN
ncbi:MAG: hypothetical protein ACRDQF_18595, partial [Thermocrispum sp.]